MKKYINTLDADVNDGREAASDPVGGLAEVIAFAGLFDVLQNQSSVDNFYIGVNLSVKITIVGWLGA